MQLVRLERHDGRRVATDDPDALELHLAHVQQARVHEQVALVALVHEGLQLRERLLPAVQLDRVDLVRVTVRVRIKIRVRIRVRVRVRVSGEGEGEG